MVFNPDSKQKSTTMRKVFLISLSLVFITLAAQKASAQEGEGHGQDYSTAIGFKFYPGAISVKHFIRSEDALEGLGYFWEHGFRFTGLYEIYGDIGDVDGLKWYIGPGAHVSSYTGGANIGVDGVLGLDYKFEDAPINLSVDFQPS